jgi:transcriptional regulator with XRE-family HTH domain
MSVSLTGQPPVEGSLPGLPGLFLNEGAMRESSFEMGTALRGHGQPGAHRHSPRDAHIGHRIRQQRLLIGLSRGTMAAALGVSEEQLENYELGAWIDLNRLYEIADLLGVSINFFNQDSPVRGASASASRAGNPMSRAEAAMPMGHPVVRGKLRLRWLG